MTWTIRSTGFIWADPKDSWSPLFSKKPGGNVPQMEYEQYAPCHPECACRGIQHYTVYGFPIVGQSATVYTALNISRQQHKLVLRNMTPEDAFAESHVRNYATWGHVQAEDARKRAITAVRIRTKNQIVCGYSVPYLTLTRILGAGNFREKGRGFSLHGVTGSASGRLHSTHHVATVHFC